MDPSYNSIYLMHPNLVTPFRLLHHCIQIELLLKVNFNPNKLFK